VNRPRLTPADVEDLRLLREAALHAAGVPILVEQPPPEPVLPAAPPAAHLIAELVEQRWKVAHDPVWLRRCPTCGKYTTPREGVRPGAPYEITWVSITDPIQPTMAEIERCLLCSNCRTPWPGPILQAWTRPQRPDFAVELALIATNAKVAHRVSREVLAQAYFDVVKFVWEDMERVLLDLIANHPMCDVRGCAERARAAFQRNPLRPVILPIDITHLAATFNICARHRYDLLRDSEIGMRPASLPETVATRPDPAPRGQPGVLGRIDSLIEGWERRPDAYRWRPSDGDHFE